MHVRYRITRTLFFILLSIFILLIIAWRVDRTFFHPYIPNYSDQIRNDVTTTKFTIPKDKVSCEARKGVWKKIGISPREECNLKTTDGGSSWTSVYNNYDFGLIDLFFHKERGWAVGTNGFIVATSDSGRTWVQLDYFTDHWLYDVFFY